MTKFIEVTDRSNGKKRLIAIDKIISIFEEPDGKAFIEVATDKRKCPVGLYCAESYVDIYNYFATYEYI